MNSLTKSWITTICGGLAGLAVVGFALYPIIDKNPNTEWSMELLIIGAGMIGVGVFARDNGVSSEEARGDG